MAISRRYQLGWGIVISLSLVPLLLWWIVPPLTPRFSNLTISLANIGQIFGLVGVSMFALNFVLSTRLPMLEKYFYGLNQVYNRHHQLGQVAFILLLLHPLLLIMKYAGDSYYYAARFLLPGTNWPINWGILALLVMIVLLVLTLYWRPRYDIWKISHKFFGAVLFVVALHVWFIPSDISRNLPLRLYILLLVGLAVAAFVYRTILGKWLVRKYVYLVKHIINRKDSIIEIALMPQGKHMIFIPGQFIFVSFLSRGISAESHPFSLISGPADPELVIAVKKSGDFTDTLNRLQVGDRAIVEGPFGVLNYRHASQKNQIWIAGGIGITPFVSMAKSLLHHKNYSVDLYYCTKEETEMVFLDQLQHIVPSLRVIPYPSRQMGRISANVVEEMSDGLKNKQINICAPVGMVDMLKKQLKHKGVPVQLISSEEFSF